jgi:hypothetical protein
MSSTVEPIFSRGDISKILNVTSMTIRNREKRKQYPEPRRDLNGHRIYSLQDVFNLQLLTYHMVDPRPVLSVLYDRGYKDVKTVSKMIDDALAHRKGEQ